MSSTVPAPLPDQPAGGPPALSQGQRIVNAFVAPSKTFEDIRRSASWWLPWLLLVLGTMGFSITLAQKVDLEPMIRQQIANSARAQQFDSLPKEQQEQQIALGVKIGKIFTYFTPVFAILIALLISLILWGTFNFIHAADLSFGRTLAIYFYGTLPGLVYAVLGIISLALKADTEGINVRNAVATNVAYFLDYANTPKFLYGMAGMLDVIVIWQIALLGMGFSINSANRKLTSGTAIATVAGLYLFYKLIFSALGWV
ncbi:MAG: YIP1 family protein [Acidobacteriia bacterium]|nr:YIP1 family protein [Terriglobia bacterium]